MPAIHQNFTQDLENISGDDLLSGFNNLANPMLWQEEETDLEDANSVASKTYKFKSLTKLISKSSTSLEKLLLKAKKSRTGRKNSDFENVMDSMMSLESGVGSSVNSSAVSLAAS